jgi:hypothetical protein
LADRLAAGTGHARADDAVHDKPARDVFQLLGHVRAELFQDAAARAAGLAGREHLLVARKTSRERLALRLIIGFGCALRRASRGASTRLRGCDLLVFEAQFELIQRLGRRPKPVPAMPGKLMLELLDLQRLGLDERHQIDRRIPQFGGIFGQRIDV